MGETVAQRQQLRFPPSQAVDQPAAAAQAGNPNPEDKRSPTHSTGLSVCLPVVVVNSAGP